MQKLPCSVIQDLLVLYEDDVCSEETKRLVEEHIAYCEECRGIYEKTIKTLPKVTVETDFLKDVMDGFKEDKDRMKGELSEQWKMIERAFNKLERKIVLRLVIVVIVLAFLIPAGTVLWRDVIEPRIDRVDYEDIKITEMYELSNGDIYCTFETKEKFMYAKTDCIQVPEGQRWKDCEDGWQEIYFQYPHFNDSSEVADAFSKNKITLVFPRMDKYASNSESETITHKMKTIYYNQKGAKDAVIIWEEGQKLPKAPAKVEEKVRQEMEEYWGEADIDYGSYSAYMKSIPMEIDRE